MAIGDSFTEGIGDPEPASPGGTRGKVAIYNENLRAIAQRHDAIVADMWSLRELQDPRMWAPDRLHFSPLSHHTIARMVLASLTVENDLEPYAPEALPIRSWRQARADDTGWAREHLMPWVVRRIRHQSSGDNITAKRPMTGSVSFGQSIEEAKHHRGGARLNRVSRDDFNDRVSGRMSGRASGRASGRSAWLTGRRTSPCRRRTRPG